MIKEMSTSLKVRKIGALKHKFAQFAKLSFFFPSENDKEKKVCTFFKCKLHLVKGLRANILIGNNILTSESFIPNVGLGHTVVGSYGVKIAIKAKQKSQFIRRKLLAESNEIVPPRFEAMIPLLPVFFLDNRDFLFYPTTQINLTLFAHIINHEITKVLVKNTFDQSLCILRHQKLGHMVDIRYNN